MLLTCPKCQKRYYVDASDVGLVRPVKCSACLSIWVAERDDLTDASVLTLERSFGEAKEPAAKGFARKIERPLASVIKPRRRRLTVIATLFAAASVVVMQPQFLSLSKSLTRRFIPHLYQGGRVAITPCIFRIQNLKIQLDNQTGLYTLKGQVINVSDKKQNVPLLMLDLWAVTDHGKQGNRASQASVSSKSPLELKESSLCTLPRTTLNAGESMSFTHAFTKPLLWLRSLTVRLGKGAIGTPTIRLQ